MLQSALCDYSYAYIVVKGAVNVADPNNNAYDKKLPSNWFSRRYKLFC